MMLSSPALLYLMAAAASFVASVASCSQDRSHEKGHLSKRQALKRRQREAVLSRHEVTEVVDLLDERVAATPTCTRITCVRNMPDASTGSDELADIYRRLEEEASSKTSSNKDRKKSLEVESTQRSPVENKSKTSSKEQTSISLRVD